jgi:hypothetical protein
LESLLERVKVQNESIRPDCFYRLKTFRRAETVVQLHSAEVGKE